MYKFDVPELGANGLLTYHRMWGVRPECLADCLQDLHHNQGTLACVRHKTKPVMGTQGHPEIPTTSRSIQKALIKVFFDMIDAHRKTKQRSAAPEPAPACRASSRSLSGRSLEAEEEEDDEEAQPTGVPVI